MAEFYPEVLTIQETSEYLRIPVSSLYRLAQSGRIPCQKVGRHWRFHRGTLDRWVAGGVKFESLYKKPGVLDFS